MNAAEREVLAQIVALAREVPREALAGWLASLGDGQSAPDAEEVARTLVQVGPPGARQSLSRLVETWQTQAPSIPVEGLRWAVEAAYATDAVHHEAETVELVWSGPAPPGSVLRRTDQALLELVRDARESLLIVTFAAYKIPELVEALVQAADRGVRIRFVLEDAEESGGRLTHSASHAFSGRLEGRAEFYVWPADRRERDPAGRAGALHAKCAVADERVLLVSSANLTEHAMALNIELGILIRGGLAPRHVARHLRHLMDTGTFTLP